MSVGAVLRYRKILKTSFLRPFLKVSLIVPLLFSHEMVSTPTRVALNRKSFWKQNEKSVKDKSLQEPSREVIGVRVEGTS